eukprot:scaffold181013_cov20-Prasinocladus_malaysianus.AAC.1
MGGSPPPGKAPAVFKWRWQPSRHGFTSMLDKNTQMAAAVMARGVIKLTTMGMIVALQLTIVTTIIEIE